MNIPETQTALQLTCPGELTLNIHKSVHQPGAYQILCRVESVGLCFSDLKLLKQFSGHARKSEILSGIDSAVLEEIPSYVPGEAPTVLGHEAVVRVVAMGNKVTGIEINNRYLIQADYRWLPTAASNAAFGYNLEGALQEYVLMDQRIFNNPEGDSALIPASENYSASAIALAEPWACVEEAYAVKERTQLQPGGQMLIIADEKIPVKEFTSFLEKYGQPGQITYISKSALSADLGIKVKITQANNDIISLPDEHYHDIVYFGSNPRVVEQLFCKLAANGLLNIVLGGKKIPRLVSSQVGRIHYGNIRVIGTSGTDPAESMRCIPATGEIRKGDKVNIIGAAGPMGVMHVIRDICQGIQDVSIFAGDLDDNRLAALSKFAAGLAEKNRVSYHPYNPAKDKIADDFDYMVVMAPSPKLVAGTINTASTGGIINIFAGIPAGVNAELDLNTYIEKQLYFIATSGSTLEDMKAILNKVETGRLDTNISVAAVCGINQAGEGIRAVENHVIPGKIIVYPACKDLPLMTLDKLEEKFPQVSACLKDGLWTKAAEQKLLEICS